MSFQSFIAELKRRRVIRVAGAYAVAAWISIQVADTVLPRVGAEDWAVTLVIVLAVVGFVIAVALSWAFDITGDGIERTSSSPVSTSRPAPRRAAWFAAGILVSLSLGWYVAQNRPSHAADLNPMLVAVLPFRVGGAAPDVAFLREGMLDMIAATLLNTDSTRAVDPATALTHWRRAVSEENGELPRDSALALARRLGAAHMLVGSVTGTSASLTINVELIDVETGEVRLPTDATGSADSVPYLVKGIAGEVIAHIAGEASERRSLLDGVPFPAIVSYLKGMKAFRQGHFGEAVREHRKAFEADSTFVLAAIGVDMAMRWGGEPSADMQQRAQRVMWALRTRLAPADRAYVEAVLGPRYPAPSTHSERLAAAREMHRIAPDRTDARFLVADYLFHYGMGQEITDAHKQSADLFDSVLKDDPDHVAAKTHRIELALASGDTVVVQRLAAEIIATDSAGEPGHMARWYSAALREDTVTLQLLLKNSPRETNELYYAYAYHTPRGGVAGRYADAAMDVYSVIGFRPTPVPPFFHAIGHGQYRRAAGVLAKARTTPDLVQADFIAIHASIYASYDSMDAAAAVKRLENRTGAQRPAHCLLGEWYLARGSFSRVNAEIAEQRKASGTPQATLLASVCADYLEARLAAAQRRPDAAARLKAIDSTLAEMPAISPQALHGMNIGVAAMYEERGDAPAALRAIRRRYFYLGDLNDYVPVMKLTEGRLATAAGDRDAATRAYREYLAIMTDADESFRPAIDGAKRELLRLQGPR